MHKAKVFFYVCAGLLCLALAYHFGAVNATAQAPGNPAVGISLMGSGSSLVAITQSGDLYSTNTLSNPWTPSGNIFAGPTPALRESFGALKSRYRGERGAAQPAPQAR